MKRQVLVLQETKRSLNPILLHRVWGHISPACFRRQLTFNCTPREDPNDWGAVQAKHTTNLREKASKRKHDEEINQEALFLNVLESTATKREARAYLSRFGPKDPPSQITGLSPFRKKDIGVNLGNLYVPGRIIDGTPVFSTTPIQSQFIREGVDLLHTALVKIRMPQPVEDSILHGIGHTLSQLVQLGLSCVVVIDPADGTKHFGAEETRRATEQADHLAEIIEGYGDQGARRLDSVVGVNTIGGECLSSVKLKGCIQITDRELLLAPLRKGITPIIAPVGFNSDTQRLVQVDANEVMLALTRELAGLQTHEIVEEDAIHAAKKVRTLQKQISLDRIIILDPLGGIPSTDSSRGSHVFINLEQEFDVVKEELVRIETKDLQKAKTSRTSSTQGKASKSLCTGNLNFNSVASELATAYTTHRKHAETAETDRQNSSMNIHLQNLELLRNTLALLPPSSSAFLTTLDAVANSQSRPPLASQESRVRTRRQRNPLIHNLLTDKPVLSSSLPSNRTLNSTAQVSFPVITSSPATFFKRGMPIGIVPDPRAQSWAAPSASSPSIDMFDPRIDLSRLVHLIDDSFNRKLDVSHYLNRIKHRVAGIIIAGEYEGGAILTWETPPGSTSTDPGRAVPYLDKFAVLKRSQGAGGVADIVFKTMVRDCFPNGVCWRSRKNNPINKWYFERAKGTWKIAETNWTMFWTTEGLEVGDRLFLDYAGVCKTVEPSWADKKNMAD